MIHLSDTCNKREPFEKNMLEEKLGQTLQWYKYLQITYVKMEETQQTFENPWTEFEVLLKGVEDSPKGLIIKLCKILLEKVTQKTTNISNIMESKLW